MGKARGRSAGTRAARRRSTWSLSVPAEASCELPDVPWSAKDLRFVDAHFAPLGLLVSRDDPRVARHPEQDLDSPDTARDLWVAYDGLAAGSVGGHRLFAKRDREHVEAVQVAMQAACRFAGVRELVYGEDRKRVIAVPSCWHAAIWLTLMQLKVREEGGQLAFRGQADPSWDLITSWHRVADPDKRSVLRRRNRFERIVSDAAQRLGFFLDGPARRAVSQHYGMKTRLLDFTTDPMVAIRFALDFEGGATTTQRMVWFRDVTTLARRGSRFVLPPPFLRRLHAQRGFFVEASRPSSGAALRRQCFGIVFDWLKETEDHFQPVWLNEGYEIYPETKWIELAAELVSDHDQELSRRDTRRLVRERVVAQAVADFEGIEASDDPADDWSTNGHTNALYDALYRLAVAASPGGPTLRYDVARAIVRANPAVTRALIGRIRQRDSHGVVDPSDLELAQHLEKLSRSESSRRRTRRGSD